MKSIYLYDKKKDMLLIYEMIPKIEEIKKYRDKYLSKKRNIFYFTQPLKKMNANTLIENIIPIENNIEKENILNNYINNDDSNTKLFVIKNLLQKKYYISIKKSIIEIPKKLYLLELLLKEEFKDLKKEKIDSQLKLFYIVLKESTSSYKLEKITKKLENDRIILSKVTQIF